MQSKLKEENCAKSFYFNAKINLFKKGRGKKDNCSKLRVNFAK